MHRDIVRAAQYAVSQNAANSACVVCNETNMPTNAQITDGFRDTDEVHFSYLGQMMAATMNKTAITNLAMTMTGPDSFRLSGRGGASQVYGIYASTNVALPATNWWRLGATNSDDNGLIQFLDSTATNQLRCYQFGQ